MAYDPHLEVLMDEALADRAGITKKKMFGGFCWLLNGNMLSGVGVSRFMFRVGKELQTEALKRPGAEIVDFNGRKMGGILWVDADAALEAGLDSWLDLAAQFAGSLPPK